MSHVDTPWTRLAARVGRGLLARKGVSYEDLAAKISAMGVPESLRGAESKIQRGAYRLTFFLQVLRAIDAEYPPQWKAFLDMEESWESIAEHILVHELAAGGLDPSKLSKRLAKFDITSPSDSLESQIAAGAFPFTLLLQLALVVPISGLCRFVDQADIERAATESSEASRQ